MRTLGDIITAAKDGQQVEQGELLLGLLALAALHSFNVQDILAVWEKSDDVKPFGIKWRMDEAFKRNIRGGRVPRHRVSS